MPGILVGYARTSTADQQAGLDAQVRDLKAAGAKKSSPSRYRPSVNATDSTRLCGSSAVAIPWRSASLIVWPGAPRTCCGSWKTSTGVASA